MKEQISKSLDRVKQNLVYWIKDNEANIERCLRDVEKRKKENVDYRITLNEVTVLLEVGETLFKEEGEVK